MGRTPRGETRERIYRYMLERLLAGEPPSVREVQHHFGFRAVQTARQHLEALVTEGRLEVARGRARGYRLPASDARAVYPVVLPSAETDRLAPSRAVPVLGRVAAGLLSTAVEDLEGYIPVQIRNDADELFALRVRGDSMIGAGILPGDLVIVRRQASAESGDIVVALVGDEATVKRLRIREQAPELHAENPAYAPIVPSPSELRLLGKVIEVRRSLR